MKMDLQSMINKSLKNHAKKAGSSKVSKSKLTESVKKSLKKRKILKENENIISPQTDVVDAITLDVPLFLLILEYVNEGKKEDIDLHQLTADINEKCKERGLLSVEDYEAIIGGEELDSTDDDSAEEIGLGSSEISESVIKFLNKKLNLKLIKEEEDKTDDEEESNSEVSLKNPDAEGSEPNNNEGGDSEFNGNDGQDGKINPNLKKVQEYLTQAQIAARALGNEKLMQQIGNTITYFTREFVVGTR